MPAILHDKFYTPAPTARKCVGALWRVRGMQPDDLFVEPSAGAGAFCRHLLQDRLLALDIAPEAEGITAGDFLAFEAPAHGGRIVVIGNPPFGRNGALARSFLRHAMEFADIVAFILPASFAKPSMQRGIDPRFHLMHSSHLDDQHFETAEGHHVVNTVFQIWQKRDELRQVESEPAVEIDFAFVADIRAADLVIRRVGARAGAVLARPSLTHEGPVPSGYSPNSNYFIKAVGCDPARLEERLRALDLSRLAGNAVYPSLSKRELVGAYIEALEREMVPGVIAHADWVGPMMAAAGDSVVGRGSGDLTRAGGRTALTAQAGIFGPCGHSAKAKGPSLGGRAAWTAVRLRSAEVPRKPAPASSAVEDSPAAPAPACSAAISRCAAMERETLSDWMRRYDGVGIAGYSNSYTAGPAPLLVSEQKAELAQMVREEPDLEAKGMVRSLRRSQAKARGPLWRLAQGDCRQSAGARGFRRIFSAPRHSKSDISAREAFRRTSAAVKAALPEAAQGTLWRCGIRTRHAWTAKDAPPGTSMRSRCSYSIDAHLRAPFRWRDHQSC